LPAGIRPKKTKKKAGDCTGLPVVYMRCYFFTTLNVLSVLWLLLICKV
jgi:hypothetical protein